MKKIIWLTSLFLMGSTGLMAQSFEQDVQSPRSIIKALYEVISGEAGAPRQWDRFQYLFAKDARLIPTSKSAGGEFGYRILSPAEYVTMFTSRIQTGFYEAELHQVEQAYGTIHHVWSTYATRQAVSGPETNRGINSIQLFFDGKRYYIMNIFWCAESMGFPLPAGYLPK